MSKGAKVWFGKINQLLIYSNQTQKPIREIKNVKNLEFPRRLFKLAQKKGMNHDQLQAKCFQYVWNTYPNLRRLMWHTPNETKQDDFILKEVAKVDQGLASKLSAIVRKRLGIHISTRKAIGVVKGVTDLTFYYNGRLHAFDVKLGKDRMSEEQKEFAQRVINQGGTFDIIDDFEKFKITIDSYINQASDGIR